MSETKQAVRQVKDWIENFVLHYNFCPFAHKPFKQDTIRYFLSSANSADILVDEIIDELIRLKEENPEIIETTIMIVPNLFDNFEEFNQFSAVVDQILSSLKLVGVIQVATFHPRYQFGDLEKDDVRNYTNRAPFPIFHLIRESSVAFARGTYKDIESIPEKNMQTLLDMGLDEVLKNKNSV